MILVCEVSYIVGQYLTSSNLQWKSLLPYILRWAKGEVARSIGVQQPI